jgi:hypothetical protein
MPSSADLLSIYQRLADLEGPGLSPTAALLNPGAVLTAFATFPTAADIASGVSYPYTSHYCETSTFAPAGIDPSQDQQTHVISTVLVYGEEGDPLAALSERDAVWRNAYRAWFLLHLRLTDKNVDMATATLTITPTSFDLFNKPQVGIKCSWPITTRVELPTGQ